MQDEYLIDKARVRASFDRAAKQYDAAAILQKIVREEMLGRLDLMTLAPKRVLDVGCGTGRGTVALQKRYSKAQVLSLDVAMGMLAQTQANLPLIKRVLNKKRLICADAEALPIATSSIDLIWSNLAIQWCNDLDSVFQEVKRGLTPNGLFMFSTFGPDTLKELRIASQTDGATSVSRFIDMHDIGDALTRAGFSAPVLDVERYTLTYDDVKAVMRDLKAIGAHNATSGRARGLMGKGFLKQLAESYEQFRQEGKLPATFEVVYGHAWRPEQKGKLEKGVSPIHFKAR